jgi:Uma2 family endonuclease
VDRTGKQDIYRQQGVPWLWFVDPSARTIEVLSRAEQHWILAGSFGGDGEMRIPPFDAVPIDVGALWEARGSAQST